MHFLVFLLGAVVGSGVGAVLYRLEKGTSWIKGRSACTSCKKSLGALDLIPIFSWLLLRGRCRFCKKAIGIHYPAIELATALLFVLAFHLRFGNAFAEALENYPSHTLTLLFRDFYAIAVLVVVFVFDLRKGLILDRVTVPAILLLGGLSLYLGMRPLDLFLGLAVGGGVFFLQYVISRGRWIGGGDIRLGVLMGALLGWPKILVALFLAYVCGALIGVLLISTGKKTWQSRVPFGTFLTTATFVTLYFGDKILGWYGVSS